VPTLFLDTGSDTLVAGVVVAGELAAGAARSGVRAQEVLGLVDEVLGAAGIARPELVRVAVGTGPGAFTGLRIGVATARGIASALELPLAGLSTLAALAQPAAADAGGEPVWASLDARRGERFLRRFRRVSGIAGFSMIPDGELLVVPTEEAARIIGASLVADGPLRPAGFVEACALAAYDDPQLVLPRYGREPDAVPRAQQGGGA